MHELSIAISIIDVATEQAAQIDGRVTAVHLRLGPLSGVVKEALLSAYARAREGSPLADSNLKIEEMPIIAWCGNCNAEKIIASMQRLRCPDCQSPTPVIHGGSELEVFGLEITDTPAVG